MAVSRGDAQRDIPNYLLFWVMHCPEPRRIRGSEANSVLPVKTESTNQSDERLVSLGFVEEVLGLLALTDDGLMRMAMGKRAVSRGMGFVGVDHECKE